MKLLFDASALLNIIRLEGPSALRYLWGGFILTLTPYEVGNALWKEATLRNKITINEALALLELVEKTYRILNIVTPKNTLLVLELAHKLRTTYYDTSYIVAAYELNAKLITDDEELRRRVMEKKKVLAETLGREVELYSTNELVELYRG